MSFRMIKTHLAVLVFAGSLLTAGCGGDDSPTSPPTAPPDPPAPPPAPTVSVVEVSPNAATLEVGKTQRFTATAKASNGAVIGGVDFAWSSSNTAVVTINNNGVATAVAAGTATIRATGNGISSAAVTITVTVPAVASVTVSPSSTQELMVGEMVTFTATSRTAGGAVREGASISWASSDTSVVSITSVGVATAVGAGTAMIRATVDGIASSPVTINVAEPPPPEPMIATVTVSPASMMIMVGGTFQFTAVAATSDGMAIEEVDFTWMSDDTEVATVDETGLVTAVAAGTAMITATASGVTSMPATVTVAESPPEIDSVEIVDAMPVMLEVGDTHQLMAVAQTSEGTMVGGVTFAWSSDDNEVATVDSTGLVTAIAAGTANVSVMVDDITSESVMVTVSEPPTEPEPTEPEPDPPPPPDPPDPPPPPPEPTVATVTVSPSSATVKEGETEQFSATAYDSDNNEITDKTFTWSSSDETVATISASGSARGVDAGSTTITATVDGVSGTATLTVTEPPPMVATVTVSPSSATIEEGETEQFSATAYTSDNMEITDRTFTWSSSDETVATISASGSARGVDAGSTTITATVDGISGTASLTVTEPPEPTVATVTVSPSSATVKEGETQQFSAAAYDSDGNEITGKTFTWESSNSLKATISSSGLATGRDAGSVTITATTEGKSGNATLTVEAQSSRTATISGTSSYPNTAGAVTFEEVAGGKLKLTITGMNTGGGVRAHLFLYTSSSINWRSGSVPSGARHFGDVTNDSSFSSTWTPSSGETIDSYSHVILHCALVNMGLGSGSF